MSHGPTEACVKCKAPLNLNDPRNGGYCGGHLCMLDPMYKAADPYDFNAAEWDERLAPKGTRKQRRAAEAKARKQKHGARR